MRFFYVNFNLGDSTDTSRERIRERANAFALRQGWEDARYWSHDVELLGTLSGQSGQDQITQKLRVLFRTSAAVLDHPLVIPVDASFGFAAQWAKSGQCAFDHEPVSLPVVMSSDDPETSGVVLDNFDCLGDQFWANFKNLERLHGWLLSPELQLVILPSKIAAFLWCTIHPDAVGVGLPADATCDDQLEAVEQGPLFWSRLALRLEALPSDKEEKVFVFERIVEEEPLPDEELYKIMYKGEDTALTATFCEEGLTRVFGGQVPNRFVLVAIDVIKSSAPD